MNRLSLSKGFFKKVTSAIVTIALVATPFLSLTIAPKKAEAVAGTVGCVTTLSSAGAIGSLQGGVSVGVASIGAASVPVYDQPNLITNSLTAAHSGVTAANTTQLTMKELCYDNIFYLVAKIAIQNLTHDIVNWINSGFKGKPAFVTNPEQFFLSTADQVAGAFIESTDLGFLCDPFQIQIKAALSYNYSSAYGATTCTLSGIVANVQGSLSGFLGGDFSQGGWDGWFAMTQNPYNNPYGAFLVTSAELERRQARAVNLKVLELNWGQGFLSWRNCESYSQTSGGVTTQNAEHLNDEYQYGGQNYSGDSSGVSGEKTCTKYSDIQTPGSVIESQLENVLGSGIRQLELADEFNEIVAALVGQLVKQVTGGLAKGLAGLSQAGGGSGSGSSYLDRLRDEDLESQMEAPPRTPDLVGDIDIGTQDNEDGSLTNLAVGRGDSASQSSEGIWAAAKAVDGDTNGILSEFSIEGGYGSVAETRKGNNQWWQIDLGNSYLIGDVKIYRETRRDDEQVSAEQAVGKYRILVSNTKEFQAFAGSFDPLNPPEGVFSTPTLTMPTNGPATTEINTTGRYVRIQRVDGDGKQLKLAEVKIFEYEAPILKLIGPATMTVNIGDTFTDPGATAKSGVNKDISSRIKKVGTVDTSKLGSYTITYNVSDANDIGAPEKKRIVTVIQIPPQVDLKVNGEDSLTATSSANISLSWVTRYANSCTASGGWTGVHATSSAAFPAGTLSAGGYQYSLSCSNSAGVASDNVFVTITP